MDEYGTKYTFAALRARAGGVMDAKAVKELLLTTLGMSINEIEAEMVIKRIVKGQGRALEEADFDALIQAGRQDSRAFEPLWLRIKDGDTSMSTDCFQDFIRKHMNLHGVSTADVQGYLAYMGVGKRNDIDLGEFRKMLLE
jgi:hypothetical protein